MSVLDRFKDGMGIEKMVIGLLSTAACVGGGDAEAERVLRKLKDEYAHELAEKIRYHTRRIAQTRNSAELALVMETQRDLADLIDPEVLNSE